MWTLHSPLPAFGRGLTQLLLAAIGPVAAAQTLTNGDFEAGTAGWTDCTVEVGAASTYGGLGSDQVAEVDGSTGPTTADDRVLCQTVSGFTVGSVYSIEFDAARRGTGSAPATVSVQISLDGGALGTTIDRSGDYNMEHASFTFTATQTTHALSITPLFTAPDGMIFDNLAFALVSALPVELLYFEASAHEGGVDLSWATATENGNDHFVVERSINGSVFTEVAHVDGVGNSITETTYSVLDATPPQGMLYYRLREVDTDGSSVIVDMVALRSPRMAKGLTVFPNPAVDGGFALRYPDAERLEGVRLRVTDAAGRVVLQRVAVLEGDLLTIERGAIPQAGIYTVCLNVAGRDDMARLVVR